MERKEARDRQDREDLRKEREEERERLRQEKKDADQREILQQLQQQNDSLREQLVKPRRPAPSSYHEEFMSWPRQEYSTYCSGPRRASHHYGNENFPPQENRASYHEQRREEPQDYSQRSCFDRR